MRRLPVVILFLIVVPWLAFTVPRAEFDVFLGGGYGFIVPEDHSGFVAVDGYFFPSVDEDNPADGLLAITLNLRMLFYGEGVSGAVAAGLASFFKGDDSEWVNQIYICAGIVPMDEVQFYLEAGWNFHYHILTFGIGMGLVDYIVVIKASIGVTLRLL